MAVGHQDVSGASVEEAYSINRAALENSPPLPHRTNNIGH